MGGDAPFGALWTCARCGRAFANRNQTHTCRPLVALDAHFDGKPPEVRAIFDRVVDLAERCGPVTVLPEGSRIALQARMSFAALRPRRAWLDGHVVLTRELASRGHHPAIDVLQSTSRLMSHVASPPDQDIAREARKLLAVYEASRDLVELGAHQRGANAALDHAIDVKPAIDRVLIQSPEHSTRRGEALRALHRAMSSESHA